MVSKIVAGLLLAGFAVMTLGQEVMPTTRPSTAGTVAVSAKDVVPLRAGDHLPRLTLKAVDGTPYDLNAAVARKPTVLLFYRGGWCHYCLRQLSGMEGITDDLAAAGYQLIALSPDKPEQASKTAAEDQLTFTLLSDSDAAAIRAFGLAFMAAPAQFDILEQYSGEAHHAIPVPAVYILRTDGTIKFASFNPDFKVRLAPSKVLEQAKSALPK
jgi:peroxiredoxin